MTLVIEGSATIQWPLTAADEAGYAKARDAWPTQGIVCVKVSYLISLKAGNLHDITMDINLLECVIVSVIGVTESQGDLLTILSVRKKCCAKQIVRHNLC